MTVKKSLYCMFRLSIFAITMLALSGICNGQSKSSFGATRAQDTSFTQGQLKLNAYTGADTSILVVTPNGTVKKVPFGGDVDSSVFVTHTHINDTLQYYPYVFNVDAFGATPYWIDSTDDDTRSIQQAINATFGDVEVAFDTVTGIVTVVRTGRPRGGIVTGNGEYDIRRRLVKGVNYVIDGDTIFRPANSQLYLPYEPFSTLSQDLIGITLQGQNMASFNESAWASSLSHTFKNGFILHSRISNDGSTYPSILASVVGDTLEVGGSNTTLNGIVPHLENVWLRTYHDVDNGGNQLCGFDAFGCGWFTVEGSRVDGDIPGVESVEPAYRVFGIRGQRTSVGTLGVIRNTMVTTGFKYGIVGQEHILYDNAQVFMCYYAFEQSGNANPTDFRHVQSIWNKHDLHTGDFITIANGEGNIMGDIFSERWTAANPTYWFKAADTSIIDSLDYLRGNLQVTIFNTTCGVCDTFFKVKGATELTQISPYRTGGYVGGFTMSRGGFRTNSGSFQTGNGSLTMLSNGFVDIRVSGVAAPGIGGLGVSSPATSLGSRYLLDSRFSTMGLGLNAVGNNLITWHHLGGVNANNGLVYSNDNGLAITNIDSMSGTGARFFIGAGNINKSTYRIAVIDSTNRNKVGWRSPLQFFSEALVNPTANSNSPINFNNDQGFMGQIAYTGSTFSSSAISPNSILFYTQLANGKLQHMAAGSGGVFEVYTGGIATSNLRLKVSDATTGITNKLAVTTGSNKTIGTATLVGGTVTVNNTSVTANSLIFLSRQTTGGTTGQLSITKSAGTSFTITSTSGTETSTVAWWIVDTQ